VIDVDSSLISVRLLFVIKVSFSMVIAFVTTYYFVTSSLPHATRFTLSIDRNDKEHTNK